MKNPNENQTPKNNASMWFLIMLLALTAGSVGGYFSYSFFTAPTASINEISPDLIKKTRPIIQEVKKVVVEQNDQLQSTANTLSGNLLAISPKQDKPTTDWQKNYYDPTQRVGEAIALTSDGWLVTNFNQLNDEQGKAAKKFVIISKDGIIYEIEQAVKDSFTNVTFIKIASRNLAVSKFAETPVGKNGNLLVAASFDGTTNNYYQTNNFTGTTSTIKSSDNKNQEIRLNEKVGNYLALVNLAGEIEAFISSTGIYSADIINEDFASLLKYKRIKRPYLGFNYLDSTNLVPVKNASDSKVAGLIIYSDLTHTWPKNSPAQAAGLKNGDIVTAINNTEITSDNKDLLLNALPGENVTFTIKRQDKILDIVIKTDEIK